MPDLATGELKLILEDNPCVGVRLPKAPKPTDPDEETGHPEFSDDDLDKFEGAYPRNLGALARPRLNGRLNPRCRRALQEIYHGWGGSRLARAVANRRAMVA
jgi:hypothetical protein